MEKEMGNGRGKHGNGWGCVFLVLVFVLVLVRVLGGSMAEVNFKGHGQSPHWSQSSS